MRSSNLRHNNVKKLKSFKIIKIKVRVSLLSLMQKR